MPVFPEAPAVVRAEAAFGADVTADPSTWVFTDLTDRWETAAEVTVGDGRSEGATQAEAGSCEITFRNDDGQLTPDDARSQWWPNVAEGTPFRLTLDLGYGPWAVHEGFISSILPAWPGRSRHLALARVTSRGVFDQLGRGKSPLKSPIEHAVLKASPIAYWRLDDGRDATLAASALPAGTAMSRQMEPAFAAEDTPLAGAPQRYPRFVVDGTLVGSLVAPVAMGSTGAWTVEAWAIGTQADHTVDRLIFSHQWTVSGSANFALAAVEISQNALGEEFVLARFITASGTNWGVIGGITEVLNSGWHHIRVTAVQNTGTTCTLGLYVDGVQTGTSGVITGAIGVARVVQAGALRIDGGSPVDTLSVAQLAIYDYEVTADHAAAGRGYAGEAASDRVARLCAEKGLPAVIVAGASEPMGPQPTDTLLAILRECETTDLGRLSEQGFGVRYRPRSTLYNQTPALILDGSQRELIDPFAPVRDLQRVRNEWKVTRRNGSSATYLDATHQKTRGTLDDSAAVNTATDDVLIHHAAWRTWVGTAPGMRYPALATNLGRSPRLVPAWQALQLGDRVQAVNLLPQHPPGAVDQLVEGRTLVLRGRRSLRVQMVTSPASPYIVGILDDLVLGRADGDASTLTAELPRGNAGTFLVTTAAGPLWTTDPAEFPLVVTIGGEDINISSVRNHLNANAFFETDLSDWAAQSGATLARSNTVAHEGTWSMRITPPGGVATVGAATTRYPVTALRTYTASAWLYAAAGWADCRTCVDWYDAAAVFLTTGLGSATNVPAATWTLSSQQLAAPANAAFGVLRVRLGSTPAATDVVYADEAKLTDPLVQPFTATAGGRGANGVCKTHPAGTPVRVRDGFVLSL